MKANAIADKSINLVSEATEYMAKDLEEFTKVVTEDASTVYTAVAEATYQSINDYAGEEIANDAVEIKSVGFNCMHTDQYFHLTLDGGQLTRHWFEDSCVRY